MNIGILTYHYVYNEGAIWQARTLCKILRNRLPDFTVEIIDYRYSPKYTHFDSIYPDDRKKLLYSALSGLLSEEKIVANDLDELCILINDDYDAVIVGSDIIWQYDFNSTIYSQFIDALSNHPFIPDKSSPYRALRDLKNWIIKLKNKIIIGKSINLPVPNAYWLPEKCDCLKISYAASIGYSDPDIPEKQKAWMRDNFSSFSLLSVRDEATKIFLDNLDPSIGNRALKVPDPAWLFEDDLPDGKKILLNAGMDIEKPIAGVLYPLGNRYGQMLHGFLAESLRSRGYQVVSVIDGCSTADVDLAATPRSIFDWWAIIKELDFFVTVRTHPNIAALLYQTPFINLDITAALKHSSRSKSGGMLADFGMDDLCLYKHEDLCKVKILNLIDDAICRHWDWGQVQQEIIRKRHVAYDYIEKIKQVINENTT